MLMEIFMNVTEALVHLFLINSLIPAKNKRLKRIQSWGFIAGLTFIYCLLTLFDMNFKLILPAIITSTFYLYVTVRNNSINRVTRLTVAFLSMYVVNMSTSIAFSSVFYLTEVFSLETLPHWETIQLLLLVAISRFSFLLMAKLVLFIHKYNPKGFFVSKKQMTVASLMFMIYTFSLNILQNIFGDFSAVTAESIKIELLFGVILGSSLLFLYFVLKNNYLDSIRALEAQKKAFDNKNLVNFSESIQTLSNLKNDAMELLTPVVQLVDNFEYEEARQMLEDYLGKIDKSIGCLDYVLDSQIERVVNLKVEECKSKDIDVIKTIKSDKMKPSIFSNIELMTIITNLFDISIIECDNKSEKATLHFTFDTRDTAIFLETEYKYNKKSEVVHNPMIDFLPETLLKMSLSKFGGFATSMEENGKMKRKVIVPYAGKAYFLRGANSRSQGVDK